MKAIAINEVERIRLLQNRKLIASRYLVPCEVASKAWVDEEPDSNRPILRWLKENGKASTNVPKYEKGEWVLIREPWAKVKITHQWHAATFIREETYFGYQYRTDGIINCPEAEAEMEGLYPPHNVVVERIGGWQGAQTMPASIGRLFVLITDVRYQRLSEMDEDDAIAEGWPDCDDPDGDSPLLRYSEAWDKRLNREDFKKFSWFHNPWTCAVRFQLASPFDDI